MIQRRAIISSPAASLTMMTKLRGRTQLVSLLRLCSCARWSSTTSSFHHTTTKNILDEDDEAHELRFQQVLQEQQKAVLVNKNNKQSGEENNSSSTDKTDEIIISNEERREKTRQFLQIVSDIGVVPTTVDSSSSSSTAIIIVPIDAAVQTVKDMITASVKHKTLTSNHVRRLFALCGERQRQDPSREMWIRMLTVIKTIEDAERDLFFDEHSLYSNNNNNNNNNNKSKTTETSCDDDDVGVVSSPKIVSPEAWNALLGLSIDFVVKRRAARQVLMAATQKTTTKDTSTSAAPPATETANTNRPQLQTELEILLGSKKSDEPHWWVLNKMDLAGVTVTNQKAISFFALEVDDGGGNKNKKTQSNSGSPAAAAVSELSEAETVAAGRRPLLQSKRVLESRVELVNRHRQKFASEENAKFL